MLQLLDVTTTALRHNRPPAGDTTNGRGCDTAAIREDTPPPLREDTPLSLHEDTPLSLREDTLLLLREDTPPLLHMTPPLHEDAALHTESPSTQNLVVSSHVFITNLLLTFAQALIWVLHGFRTPNFLTLVEHSSPGEAIGTPQLVVSVGLGM